MVSEEERERILENVKKRANEVWDRWIDKYTHILETEKEPSNKRVYAGILNTGVQKKEEMIRNLEKKMLSGTSYEEATKNTDIESKREQNSLEDKIDDLGKKIDKSNNPKNKFLTPIILSIIAGLILFGIFSLF